MSAIYCHLQGCNRRCFGKRTATGRPLCEICAKVWDDAQQSVNRLILDATRTGVEDAITVYTTKGQP